MGRFDTNSSELFYPLIPLEQCLAKTYQLSKEEIHPGWDILNHCQIVGEVAREILARMPKSLRERLFPPGSELVASAHDIGKVSPFFQGKLQSHLTIKTEWFAEFLKKAGYAGETIEKASRKIAEKERTWGGHAGVSQAAAAKLRVSKYIPKILGQHHGCPAPSTLPVEEMEDMGGEAWQEQREALVEKLKQALGCTWPQVHDFQRLTLAGLTSVADWIGSGPFFEDPAAEWRSQITKALDKAGFRLPEVKPGLAFGEIFQDQQGRPFVLKESQRRLVEAIHQPGVYLLEAPMGLGKTEAALYAAYQLLSAGQVSGIYFALPTQLTSEKIHERFHEFLSKILLDPTEASALLLHSKAWLREMGEEGQPGGSWFQQSKRGILAPFAVGTVDQALMAVMNVKHGFVRAFGLAGKVVILDEVHSYDAYTGTLLDELLQGLLQWGCTVIVLSATLTQERREQLLKVPCVEQKAYPLITAYPQGASIPLEIPCEPLPEAEVKLHFPSVEQDAVEEALRRAEAGEQVLWIENTVAEAQARFCELAATAHECGVACGLLHSRFTKTDREKIEKKWVRAFGKEGWAERGQQGRILVGTQILEQSLDLDADFMVTRFAPSDLVLQRLGRLWRHSETPRPAGALREAWVLAPPWEQVQQSPEQAFGPSGAIYAPYVLCRSLEVWQGRTQIQIPAEIREVLRDTYAERPETEPWSIYKKELNERVSKLRGLANLSASNIGNTCPDQETSTRYSEQDHIEILLVRGLNREAEVPYVKLLSGEVLPLPARIKKQNPQKWRETSRQLHTQTVTVARKHAPEALTQKELECLKPYFYLGDPEKELSELRVALVKEDGDLFSLRGGPASSTERLSYDERLGFAFKPHSA